MKFKKYRRTQIAEMHKYDPDKMYSKGIMDRISISASDKENGSPKKGDMIARNPKNHEDMWLVAEQYFKDNFESLEESAVKEYIISVDNVIMAEIKADDFTIDSESGIYCFYLNREIIGVFPIASHSIIKK